MPGIRGRVGAGVEHQVIAGALALDLHPPARDPRQRIEPVQSTRHLGKELGEAVAALDMAKLVEQHIVPLTRGPGGSLLGNEQSGAPQTPGHGHGACGTGQQMDATAEAQFFAQAFEQIEQLATGYLRAATLQRPQA